jgi:hypothetical protein
MYCAIDEHNRNFVGVPLEESGLVENRLLGNFNFGPLRQCRNDLGDYSASVVAQMTAWLAN